MYENEEPLSSLSSTLKPRLLWSLERLALVKTAVQLWKKPCMRSKLITLFINSLEATQYQKGCMNILNEIKHRTKMLKIPNTLIQKLLDISVPLGAELLMRLYFHRLAYPSVKFKDIRACVFSLSWNSYGDIDVQQLTRIFLKSNFIKLYDKYTMACNVCMESEIIQLWKKLSKFTKRLLIKDNKVSYLVKYWTYKMSTTERQAATYYPNVVSQLSILLSATESGNFPVFKYFWGRLNEVERNKSIIEFASVATLKNADANLIFFLMRHMNDHQFQEFVVGHSKNILLLILKDWRWRHLFLPIEKVLHPFLTDDEYCYILCSLIDKCRNRRNVSLEFRTILGELLQQNSTHVARIVYEESSDKLGLWQVIEGLLDIQEFFYVRFLLETVSDKFRIQMVRSESFERTCRILIKKHRWHLLRLLTNSIFKNEKECENFKKLIVNQT